MKFNDRKDVMEIYGILQSLKFMDLQITEIFELKFVLKDEIWAVIFEML